MKNTIEKIKKDIEALSSITCVNAAKAEVDKIFEVALKNPLVAAVESVVANPSEEGMLELLAMLYGCSDEARSHLQWVFGGLAGRYLSAHQPDISVAGYHISVGVESWELYDGEDYQEYPVEEYARLAAGRLDKGKLLAMCVKGVMTTPVVDEQPIQGEGWGVV